jgi:hypothetical protein
MGAFLGFVWCFERLFVKSPSGRKRFNILGALNAITHEVILVTNDTYITELPPYIYTTIAENPYPSMDAPP